MKCIPGGAWAVVALAVGLPAVWNPKAAVAYEPIGPGAITASVRDVDGRPVASALVRADGPASRGALTTRAGIVSLVALPLGAYRVHVSCRGFDVLATSVELVPQRAIQIVNVRLERASLGTAPSSLDDATRRIVPSPADPNLAHALLALPEGSAMGAAPYESRATLDGVPLAGPASGAASIRPSVLALSSIDAIPGPGISATNLDGAIGTTFDYRTPAIASRSGAGALAGYDSVFGSYQQAQAAATVGRLGLGADVLAGDGEQRAQVVKGHYALSNATSLSAGYYGSQSTLDDGAGGTLRALAPAYLATLDTRMFGGTLQARAYGSQLNASDASANGVTPNAQSDRIRGAAAGFEEPLGPLALGATFGRQFETVGNPFGNVSTTLDSLGLRGAVLLGGAGTLQLADVRSQGSNLAPRSDLQAGLAVPLAAGWTFHAAAGSAFETAPYELTSALPAGLLATTPETSFGMRTGIDERIGAGSLSLGAFQLTRWNRFATQYGARSRGLTVGFGVAPATHGLGFDAGVAFERDATFGAFQPAARVVQTLSPYGGAIPNVADSRAHLGLVYRAGAAEVRWTTLSLGPNNAFGTGPMTFTQTSLRLPVWKGFALQGEAATPLGTALRRTYGLSLLDLTR